MLANDMLEFTIVNVCNSFAVAGTVGYRFEEQQEQLR